MAEAVLVSKDARLEREPQERSRALTVKRSRSSASATGRTYCPADFGQDIPATHHIDVPAAMERNPVSWSIDSQTDIDDHPIVVRQIAVELPSSVPAAGPGVGRQGRGRVDGCNSAIRASRQRPRQRGIDHRDIAEFGRADARRRARSLRRGCSRPTRLRTHSAGDTTPTTRRSGATPELGVHELGDVSVGVQPVGTEDVSSSASDVVTFTTRIVAVRISCLLQTSVVLRGR